MIHQLAEVQAYIPENTNVWQFTVILQNAKIGEACNICSHCFIENDVAVGNNVTVKCGVYLWDGITLEDNVQIGPNVTFTNDKYPRVKQAFELQRTTIKTGASIGAASTILGGVTIGKNSMVGAGSLVTKDIPANELWYGSPAKFIKKI